MHSCCSSTAPSIVGYVVPCNVIQLPLLWVAEHLWAEAAPSGIAVRDLLTAMISVLVGHTL